MGLLYHNYIIILCTKSLGILEKGHVARHSVQLAAYRMNVIEISVRISRITLLQTSF